MTLDEIKARYTKIIEDNIGYKVKLIYENDSFTFDYVIGDKISIEWYQDMLAKALEKIINEAEKRGYEDGLMEQIEAMLTR